MRSKAWFTISVVALLGCDDGLDIYGPRTDDHPVWLWSGKPVEPPLCPGNRVDYWEGWTREVSSDECGACKCGPAACVLPSRVTAHAPICPVQGEGTSVTFDVGERLVGVCTAATSPIASDTFASVTTEPPALARQCATPPPLEPPPILGVLARACPYDGQPDTDKTFLLCITPEADGECRPEFSERFEFTRRLGDHRTCTPCACGDPIGGNCVADVILYGDTKCSNQIVSISGIGLGATPCTDTQASLPLTAVRVILAQQETGTCVPTTSVSTVSGSVEHGETRVFCCSNNHR